MPFRELYEQCPREEAHDVLLRLADAGRKRSQRCDRPLDPPRPARGKPTHPFPVAEDASNPVNERPGMTNVLLIQVDLAPLAPADVQLVRHAVWSVHPLFETLYRDPVRGARLIIEIHASKIRRPATWLQLVIDRILPVLHAFTPIRSVQFGRERLAWR